MPTIQVRRNFQITLPASIRKILGIEEGDFIEAEIKDETVLLKPQKMIDKSQTWFWTKKWQDMEKEADEAIRKGETEEFEDVEDLIKDLNS